jgi:hypothetical protein
MFTGWNDLSDGNCYPFADILIARIFCLEFFIFFCNENPFNFLRRKQLQLLGTSV